ncbi:hypothetical protein RND71_021751 [Anisodus tanguticus]|uniref:Bromo domain-containing protein n=1 Tax=Anisodus tanguticus TaxID=243964 RepID=A0AAE1RYR2_9SOLA|nr:hypothetical protein RND71_021751 [Anisodus tanguticus]
MMNAFRRMQRWKKGESKKDHSEGPPSSTRASIKRKFHEVVDNCNSVSTKHGAVAQDEDSAHHENSSKCKSKPTKLPEKRILELILDVLQRRDTHEIFAEPVDPTEVEDYYEIIKEPMDFGTMRAKLHEGMYQNLEQFEHDAFLIPKNAMHFNSSGTVYFRQARAIDELAKKVFHVLKTNPGNLEVEFPVTIRRSMRRLQNEARDTRHSRDVIPDGPRDVPSKNIGLGPSVPSTFRRSSKEGPSLTTNASASIDSSFLLGNRHGQTLSSLDAGRRSTYESFRPLPYHETSSFMCNKNPQSLILNRNASYRESLMSFAKDLGPIAQMVANWKLQVNHSFLPSHIAKSLNNGVDQPPTCLGFAAFATVQSQSNTEVLTSSQKPSSPVRGFGSVLKSTSDKIDVTNAAKGDETCKIGGMSSQKDPLPRIENSEKKSTSILCYKRNVHKVTEEAAKKTQNERESRENNLGSKTQNGSERRENNLGTHISTNGTSGDTKKLGKRSAKVEGIKVLPVVLALEQPRSSLSELKWRNKKSSNPTSRITRSEKSKIAESNFTGTFPDQTKNNSLGSKYEKKAVYQNNNVSSSSGGGNRSLLEPMSQTLELKPNKATPEPMSQSLELKPNKATPEPMSQSLELKPNKATPEPMSQSLELKLNKATPVLPFPARASSRFIFDMPFLKAQLNKMNPVGKNDMSRVSRDNMERSLYGQGNYNNMGREVTPSVSLLDKPNTPQTMPSFIYNNQSLYRSLVSLDTDLSLQL